LYVLTRVASKHCRIGLIHWPEAGIERLLHEYCI
jgi:hypothetical protein